MAFSLRRFMPRSPFFRIAICAALAASLAFAAGLYTGVAQRWPYALYANALTGADAWHKQRDLIRELERDQKPVRNRPSGVTLYEKDQTFDGVTLVTVPRTPAARLIDMKGKVLQEWSLPYHNAFPEPDRRIPERGTYWGRVIALPNGDLIAIYNSLVVTPDGIGVVKVDKDSNILWTNPVYAHHDMDLQEDGTIFICANRVRETRPSAFPLMKTPLIEEMVVQLSPDGKTLREISLLEAFTDTPYAKMLARALRPSNKGDYMHLNSVHVLRAGIAKQFPQFKPGYILVSMRNISMLAVLDPGTGKVVWAKQGIWKRQHQAIFQADGTIQLFDNLGLGRNKRRSRILNIRPDSGETAWEFSTSQQKHTFFSPVRGMQQTLPNGNVLVDQAIGGILMEVTPDKRVVWQYYFPYPYEMNVSASLVTALRYPREKLPFLENRKPRSPQDAP